MQRVAARQQGLEDGVGPDAAAACGLAVIGALQALELVDLELLLAHRVRARQVFGEQLLELQLGLRDPIGGAVVHIQVDGFRKAAQLILHHGERTLRFRDAGAFGVERGLEVFRALGGAFLLGVEVRNAVFLQKGADLAVHRLELGFRIHAALRDEVARTFHEHGPAIGHIGVHQRVERADGELRIFVLIGQVDDGALGPRGDEELLVHFLAQLHVGELVVQRAGAGALQLARDVGRVAGHIARTAHHLAEHAVHDLRILDDRDLVERDRVGRLQQAARRAGAGDGLVHILIAQLHHDRALAGIGALEVVGQDPGHRSAEDHQRHDPEHLTEERADHRA